MIQSPNIPEFLTVAQVAAMTGMEVAEVLQHVWDGFIESRTMVRIPAVSVAKYLHEFEEWDWDFVETHILEVLYPVGHE